MLAMIETHFSNHGKTGMIETTRILCRKSCEIILPALYAIVKRKGGGKLGCFKTAERCHRIR